MLKKRDNSLNIFDILAKKKLIAFSDILTRVKTILNKDSITFKDSLFKICKLLKSESPYFDWVGFYFANHKEKVLILESYAGNPTDHIKIPFGKGVCGQVAVSNKNFIVPNVCDQQNYISCNINVKSEVVVPIFLKGSNIGQIDVDSNSLNSFSERDVKLLESVCELISVKMKKSKITMYEFN